MENNLINNIKKKFQDVFQDDPVLYRSPGRVNLIGEHTDYNEGFVLPAAVDKAIYLALKPRNDKELHFFAFDLNQSFSASIDQLIKSELHWPNYLMGVVDQFQKIGLSINGFNCVFGGDIPIGAGMSSSAALEAGLAYAVNDLFRTNMDSIQLVKLSQKSENDFVGVNCGIMDQFINIFGKENKVLKIDCRSLDYQYYPFNRKDLKIVLCDTGSRRELASSEYNIRRHQCETGVAVLKKADAKIKSLRDVKLELLEGMKKQLDPVVYKRCHYVILENQRVESACRHLNQNNLVAFGKKMFESHRGLSKDYEVSSSELDLLVEIASTHSGVLGSRMMGAGFGGCTINLVEENELDSFIELIQDKYDSTTGKKVQFYITTIKSGTEKLEIK